MSYLLDTNILSELRKQSRMHPHVRARWQATSQDQVFMSVLVLGEIRTGVERVRRRDPTQARARDAWHEAVTATFRHRLLVVDSAIADQWGRLMSHRPLPPIDALLAATALIHGLTLVTGNVRDMAGTGVVMVDPFVPA